MERERKKYLLLKIKKQLTRNNQSISERETRNFSVVLLRQQLK